MSIWSEVWKRVDEMVTLLRSTAAELKRIREALERMSPPPKDKP